MHTNAYVTTFVISSYPIGWNITRITAGLSPLADAGRGDINIVPYTQAVVFRLSQRKRSAAFGSYIPMAARLFACLT